MEITQEAPLSQVTVRSIFAAILGILLVMYVNVEKGYVIGVMQIIQHFFQQDQSAALHTFFLTYFVSFLLGLFFAGPCVDRFGPRTILIVALVLFLLSHTVIYHIDSLRLWIIVRFLAGFASAFTLVGVYKLAALWLPQQYFAIYVGLVLSFGFLSDFAAPPTTMMMLTDYGIKHVIQATSLISIILGVLIFITVKKTNYRGEVFVGKSLAQVALELYQRNVLILCLIAFCSSFCLVALTLFGKPLFQQLVLVPDEYNYVTVVWTKLVMGFVYGAPVIAAISAIFYQRKWLLCAAFIAAAILLASILESTADHMLLLARLIFLFAFFMGAVSLIYTIANDVVGKAFTGSAVALVMLSSSIGVACFTVVFPFIYSHLQSWHGTFYIAVLLLVLSAGLSYMLSSSLWPDHKRNQMQLFPVPYFAKAWHGELSLKYCFWVFFISGRVIYTVLILPILWFFWPSLYSDPQLLRYLIELVTLPYLVFILVGLWRCASNVTSKWKGWRIIARVWVVIETIILVLSILVGAAVVLLAI